jgi:methylphosphotriester-DNA--protein-cysteine methyltransferase
MLAKIDQSLVARAKEHCPHAAKRKADEDGSRPAKRANGGEMTTTDRERKAMHDLCSYIEEAGGEY